MATATTIETRNVTAEDLALRLEAVHPPLGELRRQRSQLEGKLAAAKAALVELEERAAKAKTALENARAEALMAGGSPEDLTKGERGASDKAEGDCLNGARSVREIDAALAVLAKRTPPQVEAAKRLLGKRIRALDVQTVLEHRDALRVALEKLRRSKALKDRYLELAGDPYTGWGLSRAKLVPIGPTIEHLEGIVRMVEAQIAEAGYDA